ncbi:hypothetical protein GCM10023205_63830 [Yinghuangia aomiensis]|uniref:Uncharacterized protein n=1 Tax=Yinghuangia aomiensis TaxID=676205 RepID=A0ABP9I227_9ACTN
MPAANADARRNVRTIDEYPAQRVPAVRVVGKSSRPRSGSVAVSPTNSPESVANCGFELRLGRHSAARTELLSASPECDEKCRGYTFTPARIPRQRMIAGARISTRTGEGRPACALRGPRRNAPAEFPQIRPVFLVSPIYISDAE